MTLFEEWSGTKILIDCKMWRSIVKAESLRYASSGKKQKLKHQLMSKKQVGGTCFAFAASTLVYNTNLLEDVFKQSEDVITYVNCMMDKETDFCPMPSAKLNRAYIINSEDEYSRSRSMCSLFGDTTFNDSGGSAYHVFTSFLNVSNVPWKRNDQNNFGYLSYRKEQNEDEDGEYVYTEIKYQLFQDTFDTMEKDDAKVLLLQSRLLDDQLSKEDLSDLQEEKAMENGRYRVTRSNMLSRSNGGSRKNLSDTLKCERNHMLTQGWDLRGVFLTEKVTHTKRKNDSKSSKPKWKLQKWETMDHVLSLVRDPDGDQWFTCDSTNTQACIDLNDEDDFFVEKIKDDIKTTISTITDGFVAIVVKL